ncbi:potassium channel family protein [Vibrio hippocampi]|uniref:Ktr system potassium uptake protein A n=1 Tax=Vibrio hippocampi TaxID=654686 RepID=A0ABN8DMU0_9VIBR|nr:TrkA family potassium uptake protein [Vibrio hippocampi]CAH0529562.1 Ktr system potassium uptake protein A [Vibrio hippocampi]
MRTSHKQFAVIGLGRFGMAICQELALAGAQVLAIDIDEEKVKQASAVVSQAIVANCTIEETVEELRLSEYDMVMIAIGDDINASILTALVLKEAKVKTVWVKANDKFQYKILQKIGADKIIMPERDMGVRVAQRMLDKRVFEYSALGSGLAITEIIVGNQLMGQTLQQITLLRNDDIQLLAFKRGPTLQTTPPTDQMLQMGDMLIVAGSELVLLEQIKSL